MIVQKKEIDYSYGTTFESECVDANCNNCIFMQRDMEKFKVSLEVHQRDQLNYFNTLKNKLIERANFLKRRLNDLEKWDLLMTEVEKMRFQFDKTSAVINYGRCTKFDKEVSFIPKTCQLDTQSCFQHRRSN